MELSDQEKKELEKVFSQTDKESVKSACEAISMIKRAFDGKPIEADDIITRLTNVKNILERSRFPTFPLLAKQVFCRLIAKYHPECTSFLDLVELEAEALISYKGEGRKEYVEMTKGITNQPENLFYVGGEQVKPQPSQEQKKKHFWQRKPKEEKSEFVAQ